MTFEDWWETKGCGGYYDAQAAWQAAKQAERDRIRLRTALAANTVWQIGKDSTQPVYTGPQENLLDEFVEVLIGEKE